MLLLKHRHNQIKEKDIDKIAPSIPSNFGINLLYSPGPRIDFIIEYKVPKFSKKAVNE